MKRLFFFICLILAHSLFVCAQEDDNITVSAVESYRFQKGDATHPVVVRQQIRTSYTCNKYRVSVPVYEYYNDQIEINEITAKVDGNKLKGLKPTYEYMGSDGIFYSDSRVCFFTLPLEKKGSSSEVNVEKTVLDPRYFTSIYFTDDHPIDKKEIVITIPSWMKVEFREYHFKEYQIVKTSRKEGDATILTYTITGAPAMKKEKGAPGMSYLAPHLLVMCKEASPAGNKIVYFNTLDDQYAWYHSLVKDIGNDEQIIKARATELTRGLASDSAKVKALFYWVQDNIRYIAFEDGLAGFKPAAAQEVLGKKYGDCKGMANLMVQMLRSIGLDGRLCWLGTNHIAYDYSTPSLSVDNHMIAAWVKGDRIYFLDPTEKYIGLNELAERIQGRQVLIENGDKYLLQRIPVADPLQNTSLEKRQLSIEGNDLKGKVVQIWKGENKEWLLTRLHATKSEKQEEQLMKFLADGSNSYQISNMKVYNLSDYSADLKVEYDLLFKNTVTVVGGHIYVDLDSRKDFADMKFDTAQRKLPYQFFFKTHMIYETEIALPENVRIGTLPDKLQINHPSYSITGSYAPGKKNVVYTREIQLKKTLIGRNDFSEWNDNIGKLNEFYSNQLELLHQ